jgi:hypothetical protein
MASGKYFNKGVKTLDNPKIGFVVRETPDKIVIFGEGNNIFDIPKSEIYQVGINVILKIDFPEIFKYRVDKNSPLPTGENIEEINKESYPEDYHEPC